MSDKKVSYTEVNLFWYNKCHCLKFAVVCLTVPLHYSYITSMQGVHKQTLTNQQIVCSVKIVIVTEIHVAASMLYE